jgi:hypothetical protein
LERGTNGWEEGKEEGIENECYRSTLYICMKLAQANPLKTLKGRRRRREGS